MHVTHLSHLQMFELACTLIMMTCATLAFFYGSTMLPMYRRILIAVLAVIGFASQGIDNVWGSTLARNISPFILILLLLTGYPYFRQFFLGREK